ncbi:glycosyltransferase [Sulfuritalea sp.]|uniref:glycosyltransferase n=1 Tax=Sulfuritalea sp. TaxID=2480090 RepID=UPI00286DCE7D|nr:glycosyltransferase [Sulfuritalea sp.]
MNLLFLHQNFPAQFRHIAAHFAADPAHKVVAIGDAGNLQRATGLHPQIELRPYPAPPSAAGATHRYLQGYEAAMHRGLQCARIASQLKAGGFLPDLIVAHPGWGESLFLREVFPDARLVLHAEYYYHATGADVGFDPEFPPQADDPFRLRIKNTTQWMSMEQADLLIAPTQWQKSRFPDLVQDRLRVVHDGIDTGRVAPNPSARIGLRQAGITLGAEDEVVTYVARNLEPYRGFHIFMRSLPSLLKRRPQARVMIVGGDQVSYGSKPADGRTWRKTMTDEIGEYVDKNRVHFLGRLPYADYLHLLQVSTVHAYLTWTRYWVRWPINTGRSYPDTATRLRKGTSSRHEHGCLPETLRGWRTWRCRPVVRLGRHRRAEGRSRTQTRRAGTGRCLIRSGSALTPCVRD